MNGSRHRDLGRNLSQSSLGTRVDDDEEALIWASLEKLPTYDRLRTSIIKSFVDGSDVVHGRKSKEVVHKEIDVRKLNTNERIQFVDRLFKIAEEDNEKFLRKFRKRIDEVGIQLPTVEVRFKDLVVEANVYAGTRALPTLPNAARNMMESILQMLGINITARTKLTILKGVSGIVKPARMALLLGPPSSGKTTLLLALAGRLDPTLKVDGEVTYNGHGMNEFIPQKTSAYISQNDVHIGLMTVKECLGFSARCQGVGSRYELLCELAKREKEAQVYPDSEVDLFMKATSMKGVESNLIVDYTLRILGLDICRDTIVGDDMHRGISGGQKKRVTTGELIVGPAKTLFMDDISTGLDSSTTYQIVKCLQQIAHQTDATILMSLLQPAPETFELFDDIILLSEGQIVYQGPREYVVEFFESCGFRCPERKGIADFLQEVTSKKDQWQYWSDKSKPYKYVSVTEFVNHFKQFHAGIKLTNELSVPYDKSLSHRAALVFQRFSVPYKELLKASFEKEWLLMRRNSFVYTFRIIQILLVAVIVSTVFIRTHMHTRNELDGTIYIGALTFSIIINMFNGFAEVSMTIARLPVFYKHRDLFFHPAWTYTLPTFLLGIPVSVYESIIWLGMTYYSVGFAPEASRFFKQLLLVFLIQQMAAGLFRVTAGVCRAMIVASTCGLVSFLLMFLLGGFILPKGQIPTWLKWGYWVSPVSYAFNGLAVNEMFAPRWMNKLASDNGAQLGVAVLQDLDVFQESYWYWISAAALVGYIIVFNVAFTVALTYLNPLGKPQAVIPKEEASTMKPNHEGTQQEPGPKILGLVGSQSSTNGSNIKEMPLWRIASLSDSSGLDGNKDSYLKANYAVKRGMVLPFPALSMSFDSVSYFIDMPPEMKEQGVTEDRLQLLREVTAAFRPGVLTALMGISGAGKTTLMDVLAGRKTGGYIEGDIRVSGFPKKQETFARVLGYCEQTDIHSPQVTVRESLIYSAFLRLPRDITKEEKMMFVEEVIELVELGNLKNAIVGLPGVTGLSTEQRKRLTIAVELVANPSIIFMDEPTSGLDARAAAIVMRTVRNTVDTGRTVVCTIHQPSIDIFESFDELVLMKRGGQVIYNGPLGRNSQKLIEYFEAIPGVPKIKEQYNPATWMLEVTSVASEFHLGIDFAEHYRSSSLHQQTMELVEQLKVPPPGATELYFQTKYPESTWGQFRACLRKQWWTYWRSPDYNLVRYIFTLACALIVGVIFWKVGAARDNTKDLSMVMGVMFFSIIFVGFTNCSTVQPVVGVERTVFYRERAAGMYSAFPYAIAQVVVEIPFVFVQSVYYSLIVYAMMSLQWTAPKFLWFFFITFFTLLYFTYYGMMAIAMTPNHHVAGIFATAFFYMFNIFSGYFIPRPRIPKWWVWYYWICPIAWTVYGLIVSQYGDLEETIKVPGIIPDPSIKWYVEHHLGFNPDMMGEVAVVLVSFAVLFAFFFAYCLRTLNFQVR